MADWRTGLTGKLVAGGAGLLLGGPLAVLAGVVAGHAYDAWRHERAGPEVRRRAGGTGAAATGRTRFEASAFDGLLDGGLAPQRLAFAAAVIALAAKLAKADGAVTRDEIRAFRRIFVIDEKQVGGVARIYNEAKRTAEGFEVYARQVAGLFRRNPAVLEQLLGALFELGRADGGLNAAELRFLREVGRIFGFSDAAFETIRARYEAAARADGGDDPYAVLGLSRRADAEAIRRAYRELVREHHPDRLVAAGMPEELVAQADRRLAAINAAYDRIAKKRGLR